MYETKSFLINFPPEKKGRKLMMQKYVEGFKVLAAR
jgi:hypothetical protein